MHDEEIMRRFGCQEVLTFFSSLLLMESIILFNVVVIRILKKRFIIREQLYQYGINWN